MNCEEFLERYSEFRDELADPEEIARFERHVRRCDSCARYDRVVSRGVEVFRDLPSPSPSPDFHDRLKHRIYHLEDGIPGGGAWPTGGAAVLAVAAAGLLALAWVPFVSRMPVEVELRPVSVERPSAAERTVETEAPSLFDSGPFVAPRGSGDAGWSSDGGPTETSLLWDGRTSTGTGATSLGLGSASLSPGLR